MIILSQLQGNIWLNNKLIRHSSQEFQRKNEYIKKIIINLFVENLELLLKKLIE